MIVPYKKNSTLGRKENSDLYRSNSSAKKITNPFHESAYFNFASNVSLDSNTLFTKAENIKTSPKHGNNKKNQH